MEADVRQRLDELFEWWKKHQHDQEIDGEAMQEFRDHMARLALVVVGRERL